MLPDEVIMKKFVVWGTQVDAGHSDVPSGRVFFMRWVHLHAVSLKGDSGQHSVQLSSEGKQSVK